MINFNVLYDDEKRSKYPRQIKVSSGETYVLNMKNCRYEIVTKPSEEEYIVKFKVYGENKLNTKSDIILYAGFLKDLVKNIFSFKWNYDFVKPERLILKLAQESFQDKIKADNIEVIKCIDKASAGGCLIANKGTYEGKYTLFDIVNSYNSFFLENQMPTNPRFKTVDKILKKTYALYRLEINDKKYLEKEYTMKFKTNRQWFTKWDINIFKMNNIEFTLLEQENNCIVYDKVECNFEWMTKLNSIKQNTNKQTDGIKYDILKTLLSSFWGQCSRYSTIDFKIGEEKTVDREWFYKTGENTGDSIYINPEQIYKYSCAIIKPFILAYGRLRILKQVKKLEDKGYNCVFSHTDSIICNAKDKYFDIGTSIGQWKKDTISGRGIEIKNIASREFL